MELFLKKLKDTSISELPLTVASDMCKKVTDTIGSKDWDQIADGKFFWYYSA